MLLQMMLNGMKTRFVVNAVLGCFSLRGVLKGQGSLVVAMELDTNAHTFKFWVDGKPYGPGDSGVTGSLRWALGVDHFVIDDQDGMLLLCCADSS